VRPDDHPGEEISEYDRLVQPLEKNRCDRSNTEYYCEILEECMWIHQSAAGVMCGSSRIFGRSGTTIAASELFSVAAVISPVAQNKKGHRSVAFFSSDEIWLTGLPRSRR
jgi:hypothetical protein